MNRLKRSFAALSLASLLAACGPGQTGSTGGAGTSGSAGTNGAGQGGTTGAAGDTGVAGTMGQGGDTGAGGSIGGSGSGNAGDSGSGTAGATGSAGTTGARGARRGRRHRRQPGGRHHRRGRLRDGRDGRQRARGTDPLHLCVERLLAEPHADHGDHHRRPDRQRRHHHQTWDGFGGSFNEMGWDIPRPCSARPSAIARSSCCSTRTDGAHFIFGRIPIGASDYAIDRYTLNETADDYTMANFSIARDRIRLIPYVKAALAINPNIRLWASPWTPPTWMKDNAAFDGGNMKDNAQMLQALALYLAKFVQEYGKQGIKIEAIHHQNEPGYATGYPSCLWTPGAVHQVHRSVPGADVREPERHRRRSISARCRTPTRARTPRSSAPCSRTPPPLSYVKGFGLQWNMIADRLGPDVARNLPILQTEHKCGNYPWETATFKSDKAPNDHAYGVESWGLIRDWLKAGVNSYSAWNMVLDTIGNGNEHQQLAAERAADGGPHGEDADRDARLLRLPSLLAVRRAGRQARRDHRHGRRRARVQEPRRQHRRGHVQRRHRGPHDDGRHRTTRASSSRSPPAASRRSASSAPLPRCRGAVRARRASTAR